MTEKSGPNEFYEDDEPIEDIEAAFARGEKGLTGPPRPTTSTHVIYNWMTGTTEVVHGNFTF